MTDEILNESGPVTARRRGKGYTPAEVRSALWYVIIAWAFGAAFSALVSGTPLTAFLVKYLKADDLSFGLVMAVAPAAVLFQFLGSYIVERTGHVKRNFLIFVTAHRLLWLVVGLTAILPGISPGTKVILAGAFIFLSAAMANFGGAGWTQWMSDIVPKSLAGKFFGYRARIGMLAMVAAATGAAYLIDRHSGHGWVYMLIFGAGGILGAVDILLFIPVREIPRPVEPKPPTMLDVLATPWRDPLFRRYACFIILSWIGYMVLSPFAWRYCFEPLDHKGLGMSVNAVNFWLFIVPMLIQAMVAPVWGRAIDRFGPKPVLTVSSFCAIIVPLGWVVTHPATSWLVGTMSVLSSLTWPGIDQTTFYMQLKGFPDERRSAYTATFLVIFGLSGMVGTALGGVLATFWHAHLHYFPWLPSWVTQYHPVYLISIVLRLAAFVFLLPGVCIPGSASSSAVAHSVAKEIPAAVPGVNYVVREYKKKARKRQSDEE